MIFHENRLLADDSHEISYLIFFENLEKMSQNLSYWHFKGLTLSCWTTKGIIFSNSGYPDQPMNTVTTRVTICFWEIIINASDRYQPMNTVPTRHTTFFWQIANLWMSTLKTYAAISNAHLSRVCKRGKLSGSCLSTLNGFGSTQLPIFLCHIGVPTFSSQNN